MLLRCLLLASDASARSVQELAARLRATLGLGVTVATGSASTGAQCDIAVLHLPSIPLRHAVYSQRSDCKQQCFVCRSPALRDPSAELDEGVERLGVPDRVNA